jgi:hypothetical protein
MRVVIYFLFIIFFIGLLSSLDFGISPGDIHLVAKKGEMVCMNFSLIGGDDMVFSGDLRWSKTKTRDVNDYNIEEGSLKISSLYPIRTGHGKYQVCLSGEKGGNYYGALLYRIEDEAYGIGAWIDFEVSEPGLIEKTSETINLLTSRVAMKNNLKSNLFLILLFLLLTFLLIIIIKKN